VNEGKLLLNGSQPTSSVIVSIAGTLGGIGQINSLTNFGLVSPGASPGVLWGSNLTFFSNSTYRVELNGAVPGVGYDQLRAFGNVSLAGTLDATMGFTPGPGATFTIITNEGTEPVMGTFDGLPEGSHLTIGGVEFVISYAAGQDSNDVMLIYPSVPSVLTLDMLADGTAQIQGTGQAGQVYVIETTDSLTPPISWTPIETNTIDSSGLYQFTDTNAVLTPTRYYRTRFQQ
jgi:hypothetical protein